MALCVCNIEQVLIPFKTFLLWDDIKKYFFEHLSYFCISFLQNNPKNVIRSFIFVVPIRKDYPDSWVGGNLVLFVPGD